MAGVADAEAARARLHNPRQLSLVEDSERKPSQRFGVGPMYLLQLQSDSRHVHVFS